jgi:hypothetical protein
MKEFERRRVENPRHDEIQLLMKLARQLGSVRGGGVKGILTRKGKKRGMESGAACAVASWKIANGSVSMNGALPTA